VSPARYKLAFFSSVSTWYDLLTCTMSIRLSEDNHDSWGTCTTSAECKTVITVVLMVMSGMDPHMISGTQVWVDRVMYG
jgi:hypothetical protein